MIAVGKFPTYYAWMAYLPLAVGVAGALSSGETGSGAARAATGLALAACVAGLPFQLAYASYDRGDRNHGEVAASIGPLIEPDDRVYCDYGAYYVARSRARLVFTAHALAGLTEADRRSISVMVVDPAGASEVQAALGGKWRKVGPEVAPEQRTLIEDLAGMTVNFGIFDRKYRLQAYRRAGPP
jgi:hypothetical protein